MKHKPLYKSKTTIQHIKIAIIGLVKQGATVLEIVNATGIAILDVEAAIVEYKLWVKPESEKSWVVNPEYSKAMLNSVINTYYALHGEYPPFLKKNPKTIIDDWNDHKKFIEDRHADCVVALEFGYLQCEKGENIQAAFLNYNKIINP